MPGLVPGIHVLLHSIKKDVDGRDESGHDELLYGATAFYSSTNVTASGIPALEVR
jgi:hypothetical protein